MNTQSAHANPPRPAAQVLLHPTAVTNHAAILRMQQRHQVVFHVCGQRIVARPACSQPDGGDAA